jgi:antirestriction protein ArdC
MATATRSRAAQADRRSAYQVITDRILDKLREGVVPWHKPWAGAQGWPKSLASNKRYRGVNCFLLACLGHEQPYYLTYKQAQAMGGNVRKGQHGFPVVFWTEWETRDRATGEATKVPVLRYYTVFNVDQCEGVDYEPVTVATYLHDPIAAAEMLISDSAVQPTISHGFTRACYVPVADRIELPNAERFETREHYYSTLLHELTHATGAASRLNRDGIAKGALFGSDSNAREELIAEMGAAFLCGECGIVDRVIDNSASYIDGWRARLSRDPKLVIQAASAAQKAADLVLGRTWEN